MWKSKKFILAAILVAALVAGGIGGVIMAADESEGESLGEAAEVQEQTMLDRVLEIYEEQTGVAIDDEILRDAFAQARSERRDARIQARLDKLVAEGVITQAEADALMEWWQSRPDVDIGLGLGARIQNRIQNHIQDCGGECNQECIQQQVQTCVKGNAQQCGQAGGNGGHGGK